MNSCNKKRVLSFSHYGLLYGANKSLLTLILALKDEIDWIIICREKGDFVEELKKNKIPYIFLPFKPDVIPDKIKGPLVHIKSISKFLYNVLLLPYLWYVTKKLKIQVIHSNTSTILIGGFLSYIANIPHLWHFREFADRDYNFRFNFGRPFLNFWARKSAAIICVSHSVKKACIDEWGILTKTVVIYNGIPQIEQKVSNTILKKPFKALIVGVVNGAKNQMEAIKAIELLIRSGFPIKLRIVGGFELDDPYFIELNDYVKENQLSDVISFEGYIYNQNDIFHDTHLTLMCSKNEGMGRVTIESMSRSIPVIAYDNAGSAEIIKNTFDGILYVGNEIQLASQIKNLLSDQLKYENISFNARNSAINTFSVSNYSNGFIKLINEIKN